MLLNSFLHIGDESPTTYSRHMKRQMSRRRHPWNMMYFLNPKISTVELVKITLQKSYINTLMLYPRPNRITDLYPLNVPLMMVLDVRERENYKNRVI